VRPGVAIAPRVRVAWPRPDAGLPAGRAAAPATIAGAAGLGLTAGPEAHRRVLAVLAYLRS